MRPASAPRCSIPSSQDDRRAKRQRPDRDMRHREPHHHRHRLRRIDVGNARHLRADAEEHLRKRNRKQRHRGTPQGGVLHVMHEDRSAAHITSVVDDDRRAGMRDRAHRPWRTAAPRIVCGKMPIAAQPARLKPGRRCRAGNRERRASPQAEDSCARHAWRSAAPLGVDELDEQTAEHRLRDQSRPNGHPRQSRTHTPDRNGGQNGHHKRQHAMSEFITNSAFEEQESVCPRIMANREWKAPRRCWSPSLRRSTSRRVHSAKTLE